MKKILYVEDDGVNRKIIERFLQKDYELHLATSVDECLAICRQMQFEVILMDINLGDPRITGVELMQRLREELKAPSYFIATTAYAMEADREQFLHAGFDDFHAKPVNRQLLIEQLQTLSQ